MQYIGHNGQIEIVGDALVIKREGLMAKLGGTAGPDRTIPLAAISGVKFEDATRLKNGHIQLGLGGAEMPDLGTQANANADTVIFTWKVRDQFRELHEWLRSVVEHNTRSGLDPSTTVAYDQGETRTDRLEQKAAAQEQRLEEAKQRWDAQRQASGAQSAARLTGPEGRQDVQEAVARMGWKLGGGREIKKLREHLHETETVHLIAQGTYESDAGIVVLTDTRLLFLFHGIMRQRKEDFPLRNINSVQTKTGLAFGELQIFSSGNTAKISRILKSDLEPIAEAIRRGIARGTQAQPPAAAPPIPGFADQIRKLGELYKAGILTEAEFTAKKQELLGRL
ncbi:PH domain-containing protein (plasmid) [Nocardia sp. CA-084685]|uniref:PH domain-containing protein n=1 Tax=Nocardia sp. CA-084685 TaxID=3239970 RepID=UPI003D996BAA